MLKALTYDVFALLVPGSTLSFMTAYIGMKLQINLMYFLMPLNVSNPPSKYILS